MNSLMLLAQVILDLLFVVALVILWIQFRRPKGVDPQLASGLQELQNKIAVLEDLGDRTEKQVQQLMTILENKLIDVQKKIDQADSMQGKISKSMEKSLEVVKIFQDKIPHEEIHERQNTIKFVKAALLANQGFNIEEISKQVDLPFGELEFIAKVNKNELSFDEKQLPEWIQSELKESKFEIKEDVEFLESPLWPVQQLKTSAGLTSANQDALQNLGEKFRQAQIIVSQRRVLEPQQKVFGSENDIDSQDGSRRVLQQEPQKSLVDKKVFIGEQDKNEKLLKDKALNSQYKVDETVQWLIDQKKREFAVQRATNLSQAKQNHSRSAFTNLPNQSSRIVASPSGKLSEQSISTPRKESISFPEESKILKKGKELGIRPVVFPRLDADRNR